MRQSTSQSRLQALRKLLQREEARTQDELREELEHQGFEVTQSTISRDLRRLGAIKVPEPSGRMCYRLPPEEPAPAVAARSLRDLILEIRHNSAIIVIHTSPGSAPLIARHLDLVKPGGILGTVAGDDTIFVAPASIRKISETLRAIEGSF